MNRPTRGIRERERGTAPEGDEAVGRPGVVVAGVGLNGLEEAEEEPGPHGEEVGGEEERAEHGAETEEDGLHRVGVLGGDAEGRGVVMMDLVDGGVDGTPVQESCVIKERRKRQGE